MSPISTIIKFVALLILVTLSTVMAVNSTTSNSTASAITSASNSTSPPNDAVFQAVGSPAFVMVITMTIMLFNFFFSY